MSNINRVCVLTGATDGIGKEVCLLLLQRNYHVIIPAKQYSKTDDVIKEFRRKFPAGKIDFIPSDLSNRSEIVEAINHIEKNYPRVDLLINNAAVVSSEQKFTPQYIEQQFAVNYLAPFLLTTGLLDLFKKSDEPRVLNITSRAHRRGNLDLDNLNLINNYHALKAYNQSKLALVFFTYELARREPWLSVNCMEPGLASTAIGLKYTAPFHRLQWRLMMLLGRAPRAAAEDIVWLATGDEMKNISGKYFSRRTACKSSSVSYDEQIAKMLWEKSEKMLGL